MLTHIYNSDIRNEDGQFVFNAYFTQDGCDLNTGLGFDHMPTQEEIELAVTDFMTTYDNQ